MINALNGYVIEMRRKTFRVIQNSGCVSLVEYSAATTRTYRTLCPTELNNSVLLASSIYEKITFSYKDASQTTQNRALKIFVPI